MAPLTKDEVERLSREELQNALKHPSSLSLELVSAWVAKEAERTTDKLSEALSQALNETLERATPEELTDESLNRWSSILRLVDNHDDAKTLLDTTLQKLNQATANDVALSGVAINIRALNADPELKSYVERFQDLLIEQSLAALKNAGFTPDLSRPLSQNIEALYQTGRNNPIQDKLLLTAPTIADLMYGSTASRGHRKKSILDLAALHLAARTFHMGHRPEQQTAETSQALADIHQVPNNKITRVLKGISNSPEQATAVLPLLRANMNAFPASHEKLNPLLNAEALNDLEQCFANPDTELAKEAQALIETLYKHARQPAKEGVLFQYDAYRRNEIYKWLKRNGSIRKVGNTLEVDYHGNQSHFLGGRQTEIILRMVARNDPELKDITHIDFVHGKGQHIPGNLGLMRERVASTFSRLGIDPTQFPFKEDEGRTSIEISTLWNALANSQSLPPDANIDIAYVAAQRGYLFNNEARLDRFLQTPFVRDIDNFLTCLAVLVKGQEYIDDDLYDYLPALRTVTEKLKPSVTETEEYYLTHLRKEISIYPYSLEEKIQVWTQLSTSFAKLRNAATRERINASIAEDISQLPADTLSRLDEAALIGLTREFCECIENKSCQTVMVKIAALLSERYQTFNAGINEKNLASFASSFDAALKKSIDADTQRSLEAVVHILEKNILIAGVHIRADKDIKPMLNAPSLQTGIVNVFSSSLIAYGLKTAGASNQKEIDNAVSHDARKKKIIVLPVHPIDMSAGKTARDDDPNHACTLFIYDRRNMAVRIYAPLNNDQLDLTTNERAMAQRIHNLLKEEGDTTPISIHKHFVHPQLQPVSAKDNDDKPLAVAVAYRELAERISQNDDYGFGAVYQTDIHRRNGGEKVFFQEADTELFIAELISALHPYDESRISVLVKDAHARIAAVDNGLNPIEANRSHVVAALMDSPHWRTRLEKGNLRAESKETSPDAETTKLIKMAKGAPNETGRPVDYFFRAMKKNSPLNADEKESKERAWEALIKNAKWSPKTKEAYSLVRKECIRILEENGWQAPQDRPAYPDTKKRYEDIVTGIQSRIAIEQQAGISLESRTEKLIAKWAELPLSQEVTTEATAVETKEKSKKKKKKKPAANDELSLSFLKPPTEETNDILNTFYRCLNSKTDTEAFTKFKALLGNDEDTRTRLQSLISPHISSSRIALGPNKNSFLESVENLPERKSYSGKNNKSAELLLKDMKPIPTAEQKKHYRDLISTLSETGEVPQDFEKSLAEPRHGNTVRELIYFWHDYTKLMDGSVGTRSFDDLYRIARERVRLLPRANTAAKTSTWLDEKAFPIIEERILFTHNKVEWLLGKVNNDKFLVQQKNYLERDPNDLTKEQQSMVEKATIEFIKYCKAAKRADECWARYRNIDYLSAFITDKTFLAGIFSSIRAATTYFLTHPDQKVPNDLTELMSQAHEGHVRLLQERGWNPDEDIQADAKAITQASHALSGNDEITTYFNSPEIQTKFRVNLIEFVPPTKVAELAYCLHNENDNEVSTEVLKSRRKQFVDPIIAAAFSSPNQVIIFPLDIKKINIFASSSPANDIAANWVMLILDKRFPTIRVYNLNHGITDTLAALDKLYDAIVRYGLKASFPVDQEAYGAAIDDDNKTYKRLIQSIIEDCDAAIPFLEKHRGSINGDTFSPLMTKMAEVVSLSFIRQSPGVLDSVVAVEEGHVGSVEALAETLNNHTEWMTSMSGRLINESQHLFKTSIIFHRVESLNISDPAVLPDAVAKDILDATLIHFGAWKRSFGNEEKKDEYQKFRDDFIEKKLDEYTSAYKEPIKKNAVSLLLALTRYIDILATTMRPEDIPDWMPENIEEARNTAVTGWQKSLHTSAVEATKKLIGEYFIPFETQLVLSVARWMTPSEHERRDNHLVEAAIKLNNVEINDLFKLVKENKELIALLEPHMQALAGSIKIASVTNDQLLLFTLKSIKIEAESSLDEVLKKQKRSFKRLSSSLAHMNEHGDAIKWILKRFKATPFGDHLSENADNNRALITFHEVALPTIPALSAKADIACVHEMLKCWQRYPDMYLNGDVEPIREKMRGLVRAEIDRTELAQTMMQDLRQIEGSPHIAPAIPSNRSSSPSTDSSISDNEEPSKKEDILHSLQASHDEALSFSKVLKELGSEDLSEELKAKAVALQKKVDAHQKKMSSLLKQIAAEPQDKPIKQTRLSNIRGHLLAYQQASLPKQVSELQGMYLKEVKEALRKLTELSGATHSHEKNLPAALNKDRVSSTGIEDAGAANKQETSLVPPPDEKAALDTAFRNSPYTIVNDTQTFNGQIKLVMNDAIYVKLAVPSAMNAIITASVVRKRLADLKVEKQLNVGDSIKVKDGIVVSHTQSRSPTASPPAVNTQGKGHGVG